MKTKNIRFILVTVFILSAVHCNVDTIKLPLSPFFPSQSPFHIYTEQEQCQVRQNLIGRYQGLFNNQSLILDIRADRIIYILDNVEAVSQYYNVIFPLYGYGEPILSFWTGWIFSEFSIQFNPNTYTEVIGFVIFPVPDPVMPLFHRLENNQNDSVVSQNDEAYFNPEEREWEILENLVGEYRSIINENQQVTLALSRFPSTYHMNRNGVESSGYYHVEFTQYNIILTLESERMQQERRYTLAIEQNEAQHLSAISDHEERLYKQAIHTTETYHHNEL